MHYLHDLDEASHTANVSHNEELEGLARICPAENAFGANPRRSHTSSRSNRSQRPRRYRQDELLRRAASIEVWAGVIARARGQGALCADVTKAAREGIHRSLTRHVRTRASICQPGAPMKHLLRNLLRLIADGAYAENWDGGTWTEDDSQGCRGSCRRALVVKYW